MKLLSLVKVHKTLTPGETGDNKYVKVVREISSLLSPLYAHPGETGDKYLNMVSEIVTLETSITTWKGRFVISVKKKIKKCSVYSSR